MRNVRLLFDTGDVQKAVVEQGKIDFWDVREVMIAGSPVVTVRDLMHDSFNGVDDG